MQFMLKVRFFDVTYIPIPACGDIGNTKKHYGVVWGEYTTHKFIVSKVKVISKDGFTKKYKSIF